MSHYLYRTVDLSHLTAPQIAAGFVSGVIHTREYASNPRIVGDDVTATWVTLAVALTDPAARLTEGDAMKWRALFGEGHGVTRFAVEVPSAPPAMTPQERAAAETAARKARVAKHLAEEGSGRP